MLIKIKKNLPRADSSISGFTMIELIVSIFIIMLVAGIFMVNYHSTNKRLEINVVKQKLASDIRVAQNNSLAEKNFNLSSAPKGGWGVHFDLTNRNQYIIFADQDEPNGNQAYDPGEAVEIKSLAQGLTINSLQVNGLEVNSTDIVFFPPDPVTFINTLDDANARIEIKENINNSTAAVTVNFFGLIDVE